MKRMQINLNNKGSTTFQKLLGYQIQIQFAPDMTETALLTLTSGPGTEGICTSTYFCAGYCSHKRKVSDTELVTSCPLLSFKKLVENFIRLLQFCIFGWVWIGPFKHDRKLQRKENRKLNFLFLIVLMVKYTHTSY